MSWNYRIIRKAEGHYDLHEVYYDAAGRPTSHTENPVAAHGDTPDDLILDLKMMLHDAKKYTVMAEDDFLDDEQ